MVLYACKCLNIILESDKIEDNVDVENLDLISIEQRDIFFSEKLASCTPNSLKSQVVQSVLVCQRTLGRCILHFCLACGQTTHTILYDNNRPIITLLCKSLQTTHDRINTLKKSNNYSPVFSLLVPEVSNDIEMKENMDTNNLIISEKKTNTPMFQIASTLNKQMNQMLQSQLEAVNEAVKQFTIQKYAEYEAYKQRAQSDHKILSSIVSKARSNIDNISCNMDTNVLNGPPSPQLPPHQRRRLSSIKDFKKMNQIAAKVQRNFSAEDDSLDAEDVFDLEGMDSENHNMGSDLEDFDESDQEGSNDEGIGIVRARGAVRGDVARSLPMNMPHFPDHRTPRRDLDDDDYEEPEDIAASIKALARSLHGDVFELPRPRFSTQI